MSSPTTYAFLTLSISIFIIVLPFTLISSRHETVWTISAISIIQKSDVKAIVMKMRSFGFIALVSGNDWP